MVVKFYRVQQMEIHPMVTPLVIPVVQTKRTQLQNMHALGVGEAIFIRLPWSDIRDTNVESQRHIHAQCVEENSRGEMF